MPKKQRKYADDGWAIWIDGDDASTVYISDWLNPKGKSYVDIAVRVCNVLKSKSLNVYVPFSVAKEEVEDVSLHFDDKKLLQAIFNASCIVEYKRDGYTSEVAYNGKTIDIVHISVLGFEVTPLDDGTLIKIDLEKARPYLDNDEAYFIWRMPHKSLDKIFEPHANVGKLMARLRDLITTPVISEKYGYSIRINEARLLPEKITKIGSFHREKLTKTVISLFVNEDYAVNDANCYRIRRMEEELYTDFIPKDFDSDDVIIYKWNQTRDDNLKGRFNFYYNIAKDSISRKSMFLYVVILLALNVAGELLSDLVKLWTNWGF